MARTNPCRRRLAAALLCLGLTAAPPAARSAEGPDPAELAALYKARDYFTLRDRLGADPEAWVSAEARIYAAAVQLAFDRPQEAARTIESLQAVSALPAELHARLGQLRLASRLRLHRYAEAADAAAAIAAAERVYSPQERAEAANLARLARAIADVPPQTVEVKAHSRLALGNDRRVPIRVGQIRRRFALDTGANFSVIMRSEAQAAGLRIRPAGVEVATSTGARVTADLAVADEVELGNARFRHVVFLVFPDELLTFEGGHTIPGLIGFPMVEALGEVRFRRDNVLEVPIDPPRRTLANLALHDLEPLVRVRYGKDDLVCRLDTGASHTVFYEPFFRRYRERIERAGVPVSLTATGVGGERRIPAYRLARAVFTVAAAGVTLRHPHVYSQAIVPDDDNYLDCNLGLDALQRFRAYAISFRDMALVIE